MTEKEIITEIERYLSDTSYNYAVMIDGEWGCGKTYFVKNCLFKAIDSHQAGTERHRTPKYISLYGIKTVSEIQDAIVFALAEEITVRKDTPEKQENKAGTGRKFLFSSWRIAKAIRDIKAPDTNLYELFGNWLKLDAFVFIFDDIERCDCPLNEVFGFINGLVEHEGVKVILVANEKEIQIKEANDNKELQYLVALNEKIEYPKVKDIWGEENRKDPLTAEELERRRKILFPSGLIDEEFKKIREKLIGVTLHFQPDAKVICAEMISSSPLSEKLKETLLGNLDSFNSTMLSASHLNLRTFQFFLSKLNSIISSLSSLTIPSEYEDEIEYKIISDCFSSSVDYKANTQPPEDRIARITYELARDKRSKAIEQYVETGELKLEKLQEEITRFIEENALNLIPSDDPYKELQQEYYLHSQSWCEERIRGIFDKLRENAYPTIAYGEILHPLLILESMGFDKRYLDTAKHLMLTNIEHTDHPQAPDDHLVIFEDDPDTLLRAKQVLTEVQNAVAERNNTTKKLSVEEILNQDAWVECLTAFAEQNNLKDESNRTVFSSVSADVWLSKLLNADPKTICAFRSWFHRFYPTNIIWQTKPVDVYILDEISNEIEPNKSDDLIVKNLLGWLKRDIKKYCALYAPHDQNAVSNEDENNG